MGEKRILHERYALPADFKAGGMARVYRAADLDDESRIVAVKVLNTSGDERTAAIAFERETKALMRLGHPNIVELLDVGRDPKSNERYLVFEWMPSDLGSLMGEPLEWEEYLERIGMPVLHGLAHAHEAQVVHRDLKPANILLDPEGVPKIADFGIAKIVTDLTPGRTLRSWRSDPYAPPEAEDELHRYSRDVHAFGALSLVLLTGVNPDAGFADPYEALEEAQGMLRAPEGVSDLLARCVAKAPEERPADANVALADLEALLLARRRAAGGPMVPALHLQLLGGVRRYLEEEFDLKGGAAQEHFLRDELSEEVGVRAPTEGSFNGGESTEGHFLLFTRTLRLHASLPQERDRLTVVKATAMSPSYLERERERSAPLALSWRFGPAPKGDDSGVRELERVVEEHAAAQRAERRGSAPALVARWRRLLGAQRSVEYERAIRHPYREKRVEGQMIRFRCRGDVPVELLGPAVVEATEDGLVRGEVVLVEGDQALMRVADGPVPEMPLQGEIRTDIGGTTVAIRRQHAALDAIEDGLSVRPDLGELIASPESARPPIAVDVPDWFGEVDEAKKEIIRRALGNRDVLHIEGPPGTGKTTLITELILQHLRRSPGDRILLSAKTHAALDNVLSRLYAADRELLLIRGGRVDDDRVAPDAAQFLLASQMKRWRKRVERRGRRYLARWAKEQGISEKDVMNAAAMEELAAVRESLTQVAGRLGPLREEQAARRAVAEKGATTAMEEIDALGELIDELRSEERELGERRDELIDKLVDGRAASRSELGRLSSPELRKSARALVPMRTEAVERCQAMAELLGEWHARFGRGPGFSGAALSRAQVVAATCVGYDGIDGAAAIDFDLCVLDEASQATPPEALIPMTRASSWVLVGDNRQLPPFVDEALRDPETLAEHNLREDDVTETLFSRWEHELPPESRAELRRQHRMVPEISQLISECFYEGRLESAKGERRRDLVGAMPAPVIWYSTSSKEKRFERAAGTSWVNDLESRVARSVLATINLAARSPLKVAVLAGYAPQVAGAERILSGANLGKLTWECSTIDAFQGRECDLVVFLVTRSNRQGRIGFLRERPRLNVALSRARDGLIIVGDESFIDSAAGDNPFHSVLSYIRRASDEECRVLEAPLI
jgi:hypothetical protein